MTPSIPPMPANKIYRTHFSQLPIPKYLNGDYLSTIMSQQTRFFKKLASYLNRIF